MKNYKLLLVLVVVVIVGICFFFFRLYQRDMKALGDFAAAYQKFDQAMANQSEIEASTALIELKAKAAALSNISSLIKNDKLIPPLALDIANLSAKELANPNDQNLTSQRKTAYARFMELGE